MLERSGQANRPKEQIYEIQIQVRLEIRDLLGALCAAGGVTGREGGRLLGLLNNRVRSRGHVTRRLSLTGRLRLDTSGPATAASHDTSGGLQGAVARRGVAAAVGDAATLLLLASWNIQHNIKHSLALTYTQSIVKALMLQATIEVKLQSGCVPARFLSGQSGK